MPLPRSTRRLWADPGLIRTFSRNATFELEKTEALLLVRSWFPLSGPGRPSAVSIGLIRAVVALSENSEEKLRFLALETLAELVIFDISLLTKAEGLRVVLQAFIEGPFDLSPHLALAFLPIMDLPGSRSQLRPGLDIEVCHVSSIACVRKRRLIQRACHSSSLAPSQLHRQSRAPQPMMRSYGLAQALLAATSNRGPAYSISA